MCIAIAERRRWIVATDDRKAIRVGREAGLTVVSSPHLVKTWADKARPTDTALQEAIKDIEFLAQFRPNPSMPEYSWWKARLTLELSARLEANGIKTGMELRRAL